MSVYKRPDSRYWQFDFTIDGNRFRGSTKKTTRTKANTYEAEVRFKKTRGGARKRTRVTVDKALGIYWTHAEHLPSAPTIDYQLANWGKALGRDTLLHTIGNADVAQAIARFRARMADSSTNRHLTLLRAVINRAAKAWDVDVPRIDWLAHRLKEPPPRDRVLPDAAAPRLITAAAPHLRPIILFALLTGLRRGNVSALDWSDVNMRARTVTLVVKGGKRQSVKLSDDAMFLLAGLKPKGKGPVFLYKGHRVREWKRAWETAKRRAGLDDFRWHDLRHTFASWQRQGGVDLGLVQEALGHSDISTTMRYAHHGDGALKDSMEVVASRLRHVLRKNGSYAIDK